MILALLLTAAAVAGIICAAVKYGEVIADKITGTKKGED